MNHNVFYRVVKNSYQDNTFDYSVQCSQNGLTWSCIPGVQNSPDAQDAMDTVGYFRKNDIEQRESKPPVAIKTFWVESIEGISGGFTDKEWSDNVMCDIDEVMDTWRLGKVPAFTELMK